VGAALGGALERGGTDERGRFSIDQFLIELLGRDTDVVGDVGEFWLGTQIEQGRLAKSRRVVSFE
jgi:hypothetical protein